MVHLCQESRGVPSPGAGPVFALCMLTQDFAMMVAMLALTSFLVGFLLGPIFTIAQTVAKPSCGRWRPRSSR
jgi:hypothetical protein